MPSVRFDLSKTGMFCEIQYPYPRHPGCPYGNVENQRFLTEGIDLALRDLAPSQGRMKIVRCEDWNNTPRNFHDARKAAATRGSRCTEMVAALRREFAM